MAILIALAALSAILAGFVLTRPVPRSFDFVPDHPIALWSSGKDRWAYYMVDLGEPSALAHRVRPALLAEGFHEDVSKRPWFHFVKGDREVIVCDHQEFGTRPMPNGDQTLLVASKGMPGQGRSQCVLVKNGWESREPLALFRLKKTIFLW